MILLAEIDNATRLPVTTRDLKGLAVEALDKYSQVSGQDWRRAKLRGSLAGDRSIPKGDYTAGEDA